MADTTTQGAELVALEHQTHEAIGLPKPHTTLGRFVDQDQQIPVYTAQQLREYASKCVAAALRSPGPQAGEPSDEVAEAARNAYFGGGRHGYPEFAKLTDSAKANWRRVARAALAQAHPPVDADLSGREGGK